MTVVTAERNTARPVDWIAKAIFSRGVPFDSAYLFVMCRPYETPSAKIIGPVIITVMVTSKSCHPIIPKVAKTEHSVGRPAMMTTLMPCCHWIRPVCSTSQWNKNRTATTATQPTGKIFQNNSNVYSVTALVMGTGPVNVILRQSGLFALGSSSESGYFFGSGLHSLLSSIRPQLLVSPSRLIVCCVCSMRSETAISGTPSPSASFSATPMMMTARFQSPIFSSTRVPFSVFPTSRTNLSRALSGNSSTI